MTNAPVVKYVLLSRIKTIFLCMMAVVFMIYSVHYWLLVVGFYGEGNFRFDTMETHWRIASSILCVLMPIVALGLWGQFPWAPALWFIAVTIEVIMYGIYPELFGEKWFMISFHFICVTIYLIIFVIGRNNKGDPKGSPL